MSTPIDHECIIAMYDSYAKTVMRNCCRNLIKSKNRIEKFETVGTQKMQYLFEQESYADIYPSEVLEVSGGDYSCIITNEKLYKAMMQLKEEDRVILILDFWHGFTDEQIARSAKIAIRTVYNRRQRAFKTIRDYYERN